MKRLGVLVAMLLFAAGAAAQQYKWTDRNGRVQYGDVPPPGVNAKRLHAPSGPASPAAASKSLADREAEFRKRREEAAKSRAKEEQAAQVAAERKENCARAQASLRTLQSGARIMRTDAKGERYYLEEAQIAQETAKARDLVREWCS